MVCCNFSSPFNSNFIINHLNKYYGCKNTETGEVHQGTKGGITACGFDTSINPSNWVSSNDGITCAKDGCK